MIRFYFWTYSKVYGWRQMGSHNGYESVADIRKDCEHYLSKPYKILRAVEFKSNGDLK